jgi:NAD+ diphosphatase
MDKRAFFFHGDSLLLPLNMPDDDPQMENGLPFDMVKIFDNPDVFNIPLLEAQSGGDFPAPIITGVSIPKTAALPENWKSIPVRMLLSNFCAKFSGKSKIDNIVRACHIAQWRHTSRFCGTCGAQNDDVPTQAQRICPRCGRDEFPRICPAVIVLITNDENKILLAHNKRFRAGVYSHISGFNEAGETLEETVAREIKEEVNIEVKDIEYIKSQPWPFPNSLMIGFKARYASGTIKPDGEEIEDAQWFTKNKMPELPGEGSLSRFIINNWLAES